MMSQQQRNPYEVLGIPKDAKQSDVTKAFRKLASQHHPDKEGGNEEKFKELQAAYELIGTVESRKMFDDGTTIKTEAEVRDVLLRSIAAAVQESVMRKVLPRLTTFMTAQRMANESKIKDLNRQVARLERNRGRMTVSDGRPNMFEAAIDQQVYLLQDQIKSVKNDLQMLDAVTEELKFYQEGVVVEDPVEVQTEHRSGNQFIDFDPVQHLRRF